MMILNLVLISVILLFIIIPHAQAEIFYIDGKNKETSIFIIIENNESVIKLDSKSGYSEHWDSKVKFYKSGGFSIKNPESGIAVWGGGIKLVNHNII